MKQIYLFFVLFLFCNLSGAGEYKTTIITIAEISVGGAVCQNEINSFVTCRRSGGTAPDTFNGVTQPMTGTASLDVVTMQSLTTTATLF